MVLTRKHSCFAGLLKVAQKRPSREIVQKSVNAHLIPIIIKKLHVVKVVKLKFPCLFQSSTSVLYMSHVMGKPFFCIFEDRGADQLCGHRTADQRLCFRR